MFGFICQCAAIVFEASRLVMIQILLHGLKMDPIVSLHYYAPVCAVINLIVMPFIEGFEPLYNLHRVGILVLVSNAGIAFALNVAAVFLISVGSGLILTLAGVLKDIVSWGSASQTDTSSLSRARFLPLGRRSPPCRSLATGESQWHVARDGAWHGAWCLTRAWLTGSIALGGLVTFKTTGGK
jgi:hypothetical protein